MKRFFLLIALIAILIPAVFVIYEAGGWQNWQGVLPKGTTDSLYYYTRVKEVIDGHPLNGNPYVYEYRDTFAPAFFIPDIISAIPMLIGFPFNIGILINVFMWSFLFLLLSFMLFQLLRLPRNWSVVWSVILYITAYSFMLRPTIMQIVYPLFLAFLIAFIKFLHEPFQKRRIIWLSVASAATFYVYTYLSYIVLLTLLTVFLWFLFTRRFEKFKSLTLVGIFSAIMLIPFSIYTFFQIGSPYYFETLTRIGLVYTHAPTIEALFYARWIVIGLIALGLLWFFSKKTEDSDSAKKLFWLSTGVGFLVSMFLNVVIGVDMTLGVHIGRLSILWMVMIFGTLLHEWLNLQSSGINKTKYAIVGLFLILLSAGVVKNIPRGFDFFKFNGRGGDYIANLQSYASPLNWLDENVLGESVIWANESVSEYIPIMTRHYPLFFHGALLHSIPTEELEDRYLLSRSHEIVDVEDLRYGKELYSGFIMRDQEYFEFLVQRFNIIKENQKDFLREFNVKYLIIDRTKDNYTFFFAGETVYDDGKFVILSLSF